MPNQGGPRSTGGMEIEFGKQAGALEVYKQDSDGSEISHQGISLKVVHR